MSYLSLYSGLGFGTEQAYNIKREKERPKKTIDKAKYFIV